MDVKHQTQDIFPTKFLPVMRSFLFNPFIFTSLTAGYFWLHHPSLTFKEASMYEASLQNVCLFCGFARLMPTTNHHRASVLDKLARLTLIWIREQGDGNAIYSVQPLLSRGGSLSLFTWLYFSSLQLSGQIPSSLKVLLPLSQFHKNTLIGRHCTMR